MGSKMNDSDICKDCEYFTDCLNNCDCDDGDCLCDCDDCLDEEDWDYCDCDDCLDDCYCDCDYDCDGDGDCDCDCGDNCDCCGHCDCDECLENCDCGDEDCDYCDDCLDDCDNDGNCENCYDCYDILGDVLDGSTPEQIAEFDSSALLTILEAVKFGEKEFFFSIFPGNGGEGILYGLAISGLIDLPPNGPPSLTQFGEVRLDELYLKFFGCRLTPLRPAGDN